MDATRRCARCVLSERPGGVSFGGDGVCRACAGQGPSPPAPSLDPSIIEEVRRERRGPYDALVAYSGGKDSTYMLYRLTRTYGLRVLAFTFDNHYLSPSALENISRVSRQLRFDHVTVRFDFEYTRSAFARGVQLARSGAMAGMFREFGVVCWPCFALLAVAGFNLARAHGIRHLFGGWSLGQIAMVRGLSRNRESPWVTAADVAGPFVDAFLETLGPVAAHPQVEQYRAGRAALEDLRIVPYFAIERYDERKILAEIEAELGWRKPGDTDGCSTNCRLNGYGNEVFSEVFGYHRYEEELSVDVRRGTISRSDALRALEARAPEAVTASVRRDLEGN